MTKDMTTGAITPLLVKFTIPLVLGNLFQLTYNAADSIIVGKFVGEDALAAVGTSNPLMTLAILFINGLCLGAGILVRLKYWVFKISKIQLINFESSSARPTVPETPSAWSVRSPPPPSQARCSRWSFRPSASCWRRRCSG